MEPRRQESGWYAARPAASVLMPRPGLKQPAAGPVPRRGFAVAARSGVAGPLDAARDLRLQGLIARATPA
ncbi:hypothetical protein P3L51_00525 [Streptomyces sp. PSRA5]|uniref:hypothetical protein n=1 Tax=Streptomyces panacea TaxID=3035064 RepID=UPI00339C6FC2